MPRNDFSALRRMSQLFLRCLPLLLLCLCAGSASGQAVDQSTEWAPLVRPEVTIQRTAGPIKVDGVLGDEGWRRATRVDQFTEIQPGDEKRPEVRTEAWVAYDEQNLYVAFRAYDEPRSVRASLRNRDEIFQDDWVGVIIDAYGDATRAYEIFANPLGIQGDLQMSRQGENAGFDLIYQSAGRLTDRGYVVEMAIPFKSLTFPRESSSEWSITFLRNRPRSSRHIYSWATVKRDDPCLMCQLGTLRGLEGIQTSRTLEVIPALVGSQSSSLADRENPLSMEQGPVTFEPSLNLRYNLTSSLAAEATINPDFSQVESDAAQIDVNSTFALFYPERRPFFQEGSEMFNSFIDVVYTRSINSPLTAAKVTGQPGRTSIGVITALDERSPILIPLQERSELVEAGRSLSTIVRGRHSFGSNSFVGAIVSDRRYQNGGSGSEFGVDGQLQLSTNYQFEGQLVANRSIEPEQPDAFSDDPGGFHDGKRSIALDGESFSGYGSFLSFERNARTWSFDVNYRAYSPTFRTSNGFVTRNDYRRLQMFQQLTFYPEGFFEVVDPALRVLRQWTHDGQVKEDWADARLFARMKAQTGIFWMLGTGREHFRGDWFDGLWRTVVEVNSDFSAPMSAGGAFVVGRTIARNLDVPQPGGLFELNVWSNIKPISRLVIRPQLSYAELRDVETGDAFYSGFIARTRADLLFTRELSLRLIAQYNDFAESFTVEPLLAYRLNAYSVAYLGSSVNVASFDDPHGFRTSSRQFFFKLQYLFRT